MMVSTLHWADYLVILLSLLLSTAVGLYYAVRGRSRDAGETEEFLMAGRSMNLVPVSISLYVSWTSAISFLGDPLEVYSYGLQYCFLLVGYCAAITATGLYFAPRFHRMHLTSAYEFIGQRFGPHLRVLVSLINQVATAVFITFVLHYPAVALSHVTSLPDWLCIVVLGVVCTLYTVLGGMKAVLWADTLQYLFMLAGQIAVIAAAAAKTGGLGAAWRVAQSAQRGSIDESLSPTSRANVWNYMFGGFFRLFNSYISGQYLIQRYGTVKTERQIRTAVLLNMPMFVLFVSLFAIEGVLMFAYYAGCDPYLEGRIESYKELVPTFIMDVLGSLPGLPGLILAAIFSASLSSLSSGINAMAANVLKDFLQPLYQRYRGYDLTDSQQSSVAKVLSALLGGVISLMAFLLLYTDGSIFGVSVMLTAVFEAPMAAIFFLAFLFTDMRTWHVLVGFCVGVLVPGTVAVYQIFVHVDHTILPVSTDQCPSTNLTTVDTDTTVGHDTTDTTHEPLGSLSADISPILFPLLGFVITLGCACVMYGLQKFVQCLWVGQSPLPVHPDELHTLTNNMKVKDTTEKPNHNTQI